MAKKALVYIRERKEEQICMFKRMIFAVLSVAMFVLPVFSAPKNSEIMCDFNDLKTYSGTVMLEAIWVPNVSGDIVLDSNIYADASDETGLSPGQTAVPSTLHSRYGVEMYTDSVDGTKTIVSKLEAVPEKTGYDFMGFYTEKYAGGTQTINAEGEFLPVAKTVVSEEAERATWYAHWERSKVECLPGTYLPANTDSCVTCLEDNYCAGGTFKILQPEDHGIVSCSTVASGGSKSPAGSKQASDCGYVLHIGDANDYDKLYLHGGDKDTHPSLVVEIKGQKWYGNMTPVSEGKKTISSRSNKRLHLQHNGIEYTAHGRDVE